MPKSVIFPEFIGYWSGRRFPCRWSCSVEEGWRNDAITPFRTQFAEWTRRLMTAVWAQDPRNKGQICLLWISFESWFIQLCLLINCTNLYTSTHRDTMARLSVFKILASITQFIHKSTLLKSKDALNLWYFWLHINFECKH